MNTLLKNLRTLYNAQFIQNYNKTLVLPYSFLSLKVLSILKREGYINQLCSENKKISVVLPVSGKIQCIKIAKLACPIFYKFKDLKSSKQFSSGLGLTLFSTSQGIFSYSDVIKRKIGGLFLFQII